jgi:hypothetical protein
MQPARRLLGEGKSHRRSRQYHVFSGLSWQTEKIRFQNQCSDSRHPAHGQTVTLSTKVTCQSTVGIGVVTSQNFNPRFGTLIFPPIYLPPKLHLIGLLIICIHFD